MYLSSHVEQRFMYCIMNSPELSSFFKDDESLYNKNYYKLAWVSPDSLATQGT